MRKSLFCKTIVMAGLVSLNVLAAQAQNVGVGNTPATAGGALEAARPALTTPGILKGGQSQTSELPTAPVSAGVEELLKMLQAGVSKDVIRAYIETSQAVPQLSASDIVKLKERGLPDDLTLALMKRKAELATEARQASASNSAPAKVTGTISLEALIAALQSRQFNGGSLDPEGYDYFRYYYLTPRAIASANEQIFSSYRALPDYGPYSFGYQTPWAFRSYTFRQGFWSR